jgi:ADP-ribosylglycohydrolase
MDSVAVSEHIHNRYMGALLGLAAGDALGAPFEGLEPGSFATPNELTGGGPYGLEPGQWTDDTSLALCLAVSLVESRGFDPADQMRRYLRWKNEGYLSSTGRCFGIGGTTRAALERFEASGEPMAGVDDPQAAGNGSLMRLAPIPMYLIHDASRAKDVAAMMSKTTHAAVEAVDACRYMTGIMIGALRGESKEHLLSDLYSPVYNYWFFQQSVLTPRIDAIARGEYKHKEAKDLRAGAYVVDTLEAALWCFHKTDNFRDGAMLAVSLGNDTDTTAAVYGQLAGAYYGQEAIPQSWRDKIAQRAVIEYLAEGLLRETKQGIRHFV